MGSVNRVTLLGRLGAEPELKRTPSGKAVCNLRLATSETWKDKAGVKQEKTEWHRIAIWGELAEHAAKYLAKGREVYLEGRLETRTYDKAGQKHYATEVVADRVVFLGGRDEGARSEPKPAEKAPTTVADDDVPF